MTEEHFLYVTTEDDGTSVSFIENPKASSSNKTMWTHEAIQLMLSLRMQMEPRFTKPNCKKNLLWQEIGRKMEEVGHFTGDMCDIKYRNLLSTYRKNVAKKNEVGAEMINWPYFKIMDDALGVKEYISRKERIQIKPVVLSEPVDEDYPMEELDHSSFDEDEAPMSPNIKAKFAKKKFVVKKSTPTSPLSDYIRFKKHRLFQQEKKEKEMEARKAERFKTKMKLLQELVNAVRSLKDSSSSEFNFGGCSGNCHMSRYNNEPMTSRNYEMRRNSNYNRPPRPMMSTEGESTVQIDETMYHVNLDVQNFTPEEITVAVTGENTFLIEAKQKEKADDHGYSSRQFERKYVMPKGYDVEKLESTISTDGILTVKAPKIDLSQQDRKIIIIKTGGPPKIEVTDDNR